MPIKGNYFNSIHKRFDFGVPLEDIFPPNDIHPRLKHVFEEAYKFYINNRLTIEQVVRQLQGSLETRFKLKQKITYDAHYDIKPENIEQTPGAYFWFIRHFLGLLPIPLLPTYSQEIQFDWIGLSEKCKNFLQYYESQRDRKHQLDYEFAENLNLLPFEHFLLLTVLIHFIRKLSKNKGFQGRKLNRKILLFLCKYYCGSICVRPYTPGHKDGKMFPLLFYITLRWPAIEKYCRQIGHPAYFLESNLNYNTCTNFSLRDNWVQTSNFSPEIITIYKNVPYCDIYLKDTGSQTEHATFVDKCIQNLETASEKDTTCVNLKHEKLSNPENSSLYPSIVDLNSTLKQDENLIQKASSTPIKKNQGKKLDDDTELNFLSTDNACDKVEWSEVVAETALTVKKVDEYIYDDYDTFNKEEYNQISDGSKSRNSLMHKVSKIGWTYTPENSAREKSKECSTNHSELEDTYVRFEDVFDENGKYKTNGCDDSNECEVNGKGLNITFKKCYDSKIPLCNNGSLRSTNSAYGNEGKSKKSFNFKRFKLKLDFLKVLTPKKSTYSTPSYDSIESKVKYKKIKNIKSSTL